MGGPALGSLEGQSAVACAREGTASSAAGSGQPSIAKLQQTVYDLGVQLRALTSLFDDLESDVFQMEEPIEEPTVLKPGAFLAVKPPGGASELRVSAEPPLFNELESDVFQTEEQFEEKRILKPGAFEAVKPPGGASELRVSVVPPDQTLLDAIMSCNSNQLREALANEVVDPNEKYSNISVPVGGGKKTFATATPLVVAALLGQRSMVRQLVAAGASVESSYSFVAGAELKIWSGTVVHTAIPSKEGLDLMKDLAELKADMNTRGSNGANLVWQASYFGKQSILEYLISLNLSIEETAQSQDDSVISYTPLHVAVTQGHSAIVKSLISAQAMVAVEDGRGHTPLDDAVGEAHGEIVHQLVLKNADIFRQTPVTEEDCRHMQTKIDIGTGQLLSAFDRIIRTENPVLLARVLQALGQSPSLLDRMSKHNLLQVLASPGDGPIQIMEALFQKQKIMYWEQKDGKTYRRQPKDAMVSTSLGFNVVHGPHAATMNKMFGDKETLPEYMVAFVNNLFPLTRTAEGQMYVPVDPYMCHLPKIHSDLQVMMAFVDCPNKDIFHCEGVIAIVNWAWDQERRLSSFRTCLSVLELINFMVINVLMDETSATSKDFANGPSAYINGVISLVIWMIALSFEFFQIVGYFANHSIWRYVRKPRQWFGWVVLAMTGGFIIVFLTPNTAAVDPGGEKSGMFSGILGVLLFLKWFRFLIYLRQFETVAVHTLPITTTMWNVGPFLLVMAVYLSASVNLFYALENGYGLEECFVIIYRLVVLGDFSLLELENRSLTSPPTQYYHVVRVMLVGLSFVVTVTMMNLFIAVLCVAYDEAAKRAHVAYVESLASIILDQHAIRKGFLYVRNCRCCKRKRRGGRNGEKSGEESEDMQDDPDGQPGDMQDRVLHRITVMTTALDVMLTGSHDADFLWLVRPTESC